MSCCRSDSRLPACSRGWRWSGTLPEGDKGERAMMTEIAVLAWSAALTWLMLMTSSALRTQGLSPGGFARAVGNRDDLRSPTPIAGRADRAAKNMLENLV